MRISIVEENQTLLENLRLLLTGEPNCEIVGAFSSAEDAMPAIHNNPPEVLLTDLAFPGMSSIELIGKVKQKYPEMDVMAHTVSDSRESVFSAIKACAAWNPAISAVRPTATLRPIFSMASVREAACWPCR